MKELNCFVVQDLLPNYSEGLTMEETNKLIEEHFESCDECRRLYESCKTEIEISIDKPDKKDNKIINAMRFKFLWYMFWPTLYGVLLQIGKDPLGLMITILGVLGFVFLGSNVYEYDFELDDSKKEFYKRENENINSGKGSFLIQGIFWMLPIIVPVILMIIPIVISMM
ncbi:zf-HC2 domain-containing protein [Clostridium paraputrificum]|uniref:zf-HC2 domain-containing protein n=1 Tax=Clostridium TaxID=1485 RepID=UPI003D357DF6